MIELEQRDGLFVLHLQHGENRFNPDSLAAINAALDEVDKAVADSPSALVTVGQGKFYSNGLDLEWMGQAGADAASSNVDQVHALLVRMLTFPAITIAAINGHAFAAGAMLALAHDFRVMRSDRGYFCLPEIDLRLPFTPTMQAVISAKLPKATLHEATVTGRRYGGAEVAERGIAHAIAPEAEVLPRALELARGYAGKHAPTLQQMKRALYPEVLATLPGR